MATAPGKAALNGHLGAATPWWASQYPVVQGEPDNQANLQQENPNQGKRYGRRTQLSGPGELLGFPVRQLDEVEHTAS